MSAGQDYKDIAAVAHARRAKALPQDLLLSVAQLDNLPQDVTRVPWTSGHFTKDELAVIDASAGTILDRIRSRQWTSLQVTRAFTKSAAVAQQLTNCLTEVLFQEGLARAAELDQILETTGQPVGPLHGLPISLKDCFVTPPHPSTIGLAKFANVPSTPDEESLICKLLHQLGAVIYCKTNTSPAMMAIESNNNVWGETVNPLHTGLSAGGSSGGEAALIAMRGSPLGVGTDIGGSIRIPAAWQALYGLKPSSGRYSHFNPRSAFPGQDVVFSINGPMARDLEALTVFSEALVSEAAAPWRIDPKVLPIPWRKGPHVTPPGRKLRFALVGPSDGLVTCHPPVERALDETKKALLAAGHDVVDWPTTHHPAVAKFLSATFLDFGAVPISKILAEHNEPWFNSMAGYRIVSQVPEEQAGFTPSKMRDINAQKGRLMKAMLDQAVALGPLDGIIQAVSPWAAVRRGATDQDPNGRMHYPGYTGVWNPVDWPSCTFPVLRAAKGLDAKRQGFAAANPVDELIQADYDAAFYDGAPVALQCIGERLQEEKLLEVVARVRDALEVAGHKWR